MLDLCVAHPLRDAGLKRENSREAVFFKLREGVFEGELRGAVILEVICEGAVFGEGLIERFRELFARSPLAGKEPILHILHRDLRHHLRVKIGAAKLIKAVLAQAKLIYALIKRYTYRVRCRLSPSRKANHRAV